MLFEIALSQPACRCKQLTVIKYHWTGLGGALYKFVFICPCLLLSFKLKDHSHDRNYALSWSKKSKDVLTDEVKVCQGRARKRSFLSQIKDYN